MREKGRRGHRGDGGGWKAREKGGNGARYGEMARKLGIVMGNGRRSTPLTERKLEPEEIVGGHGHSPRDLCEPYVYHRYHRYPWKEAHTKEKTD